MKTELLGQEKNIVKIKLEIEAGEFTKALNKTLSELSQQVNVPGFRKGKTPRKVLEMRFGLGAIYNEALEKIIPDEIQHIVEDYDLEPIETPTLDLKENIKEGQDITCELIFEVRPEVELPEVENLEIEKVVTNVDDNAVNDLEKRIRFNLAETKTVERPVQDEDLIALELTIRTVNPDGSETEQQPKPNTSHDIINLADQTVRKEVREALIGHNKGDEVQAVFEVEPGHYDRELAGKRVCYKMKIEEISEYVLPEVNEDFYKKVFGENTEIKDYDSFRARLKKDIEEEVTATNLEDLRERAAELVASQAKLELPEKFITRQKASLRKDDEEWAKNNNITLTQAYALDTEEGRRGYDNLLQTRAEAGVRNALVMDELAKKYDVHLQKEDLEAEFDRQAAHLNVTKGFISKFYYENKDKLENLESRLRWNKIADVVISNMKVKEVSELSKPEGQEQNQGENHGE